MQMPIHISRSSVNAASHHRDALAEQRIAAYFADGKKAQQAAKANTGQGDQLQLSKQGRPASPKKP